MVELPLCHSASGIIACVTSKRMAPPPRAWASTAVVASEFLMNFLPATAATTPAAGTLDQRTKIPIGEARATPHGGTGRCFGNAAEEHGEDQRHRQAHEAREPGADYKAAGNRVEDVANMIARPTYALAALCPVHQAVLVAAAERLQFSLASCARTAGFAAPVRNWRSRAHG